MKIIVALAFKLAAVFGAGVARADDMDDAFLKYLAAQRAWWPTAPSTNTPQIGLQRRIANGNDLATERKGILAATTGNLTPLQIAANNTIWVGRRGNVHLCTGGHGREQPEFARRYRVPAVAGAAQGVHQVSRRR
jgi:hypothetical protein